MDGIVPSDGEQGYYAGRAAQERALAGRAADRSARYVHAEMASRYAVLAGEVGGPFPGIA
jgi:hypothetical protein